MSDDKSDPTATPRKRGFGAMDPARQKELASRGGKAAHAMGRGHQWDRAEASKAGRKGGLTSRGGRGKLPVASSERDKVRELLDTSRAETGRTPSAGTDYVDAGKRCAAREGDGVTGAQCERLEHPEEPNAHACPRAAGALAAPFASEAPMDVHTAIAQAIMPAPVTAPSATAAPVAIGLYDRCGLCSDTREAHTLRLTRCNRFMEPA